MIPNRDHIDILTDFRKKSSPKLLTFVTKFIHAEIACKRNTLYRCKIRETLIEHEQLVTYFIRERNSTNLP